MIELPTGWEEVTFGPPRVGDKLFGKGFEALEVTRAGEEALIECKFYAKRDNFGLKHARKMSTLRCAIREMRQVVSQATPQELLDTRIAMDEMIQAWKLAHNDARYAARHSKPEGGAS